MKILLTLLFVCLCFVTFSQESVFQNLKKGQFQGTVNGLLIIEKSAGKESVLDFQGAKAEVQILHQTEEIYDISYKNFIGYTTSGKTKVKYQSYASANSFSIMFSGRWYSISTIDGACDITVSGINYFYKTESKTEYLTLIIENDLILEDHEKKSDMITLKAGSTLVFAIKKS